MSEKKRISIDPITRIEGHLRIDCEIEMVSSPMLGPLEPCGVVWKIS